MSEAFRAIRGAYGRCKRYEPDMMCVAVGRPPSKRNTSALEITQCHHGVTDATLPARHEVRLSFKKVGVAAVGGVIDYPIRLSPYDVIEESALYVEDRDGMRIYLTGCLWGYGGEGSHGTAAILADIWGTTIEAAMKLVSVLPMTEAWRREV